MYFIVTFYIVFLSSPSPQGADTVVWLTLSERAVKEGPNGGFFQGELEDTTVL